MWEGAHAQPGQGMPQGCGVAVAVLQARELLGGTWSGHRNGLLGTPAKASTKDHPGNGIVPRRRWGLGVVAGWQQWLQERLWRPRWAGVGSVPGLC